MLRNTSNYYKAGFSIKYIFHLLPAITYLSPHRQKTPLFGGV